MKKVIFLAILAMAFGCTKSQTEQAITIHIGGVQSGSLTKAAPAIISATAPTGIPTLTLTSEDGQRTYQVAPGESVVVRVGTYQVKGEYVPPASRNTPSFGFAYGEPRYHISSTIEVAEGTTSYSVNAAYDCWALIINYADAEKYESTGASDADYADVECFTRVEDYGIAYVWPGGASARGKCNLRVTPADKENYDEAVYLLRWAGSAGVNIENGRWYMFSAAEAERGSGDIGVNLPEWEAGN